MIGGAAFLALVFVVTARLMEGKVTVPSGSIFAVTVVSAGVLVMPSFPAMGGKYPDAVWIGFLGTQVLGVLWVALCWKPDRPRNRITLRRGLSFASKLVGLVSLVAAIPVALLILLDRNEGLKSSLVFPAYVLGALLATLSYWVLQPLQHRPVARYVIGCLGGFCVYSAVGPVVSIMDGDPVRIREIVGGGLVCGCLVGPSVAFSWARNLGGPRELTSG
jgi:hypothetical protein